MEDAENNMSVKRLKLQRDLNDVLAERLKELFNNFDHLTRDAYKDILTTHDYSRKVNNELLERAKFFQTRDMKKVEA
jgi:hypothetical protein